MNAAWAASSSGDGRVQAWRADHALHPQPGAARPRPLQAQPDLAAADQVQVDLGQELAVEQRAVPGAGRVVDREAAAERVQAVLGAGEAALRQEQRVDGAAEGERLAGQADQLGIQEADVEDRVVDDQAAVLQELQQRRRPPRRRAGSRAGRPRSARARGTPPRACRARDRGSCGRCGRSADGRPAPGPPPPPGDGPAPGRARWSRCPGRSRAACSHPRPAVLAGRGPARHPARANRSAILPVRKFALRGREGG